MRSTFYGLEIAKSALFASRTQMDTATHNMANADTEGYTRQRLVVSSIPPGAGNALFADQSSKTTSGAGVRSEYITQLRDIFLDRQYRKENAQTSYYNTMYDSYSLISALFTQEVGDTTTIANLQNGLLAFTNSANELKDDPSSKDKRTGLVQSANTLQTMIYNYYGELKDEYDNLNFYLGVYADRINTISDELSQLNRLIYEFELPGGVANDLRDRRNLLLDELSEYGEVSYRENTDVMNNDYTVWLGVGDDRVELVVGDEVQHRLVKDDTGDYMLPDPDNPQNKGVYELYWGDKDGAILTDPDNAGVNWKANIGTGKIQATIDLRDSRDSKEIGIPYIIDQLNGLVRKMVAEVNALHAMYWTLPCANSNNNNTVESHQGELFFNMIDENGNDVSTIKINPGDDQATVQAKVNAFINANADRINISNFKVSEKLAKDEAYFAASSKAVMDDNDPNTSSGNGEIIDELIALFSKKNDGGVDDNCYALVVSLTTDVSARGNTLKTTAKSQQVRQNDLDYRRQSVMSVSQDEEMADIIKFSKAFNAASRVISAIDEQLDVIINKMGLVGR